MNTNTNNNTPKTATMWEGLGGPIHIGGQATTTLDNDDDVDDVDPTLDMCCRREVESQRHGAQLRAALQRHDVVAARERQRRNLVTLSVVAADNTTTTSSSSSSSSNSSSREGCRCCFDPNSDGGGDYRALMELRETRRQQQQQEDAADEEGEEENDKKNATFSIVNAAAKNSNNDSDDDDDDEFDYLLDEDLPTNSKVLAALEERRRAELEYAMLQRETAIQHGYGVHCPMHPIRILRAAGLVPGTTRDPPPAAVVVHLVDPDSTASASLDLYLEELAVQTIARGTKFMRSAGRAVLLMDSALANQVLRAPRLDPEKDLPALLAVRNGVVVNTCPRLEGLVDKYGYSTNEMIQPDAVYQWLHRSGVLLDQPPPATMCRIRPEEEALMDHLAVAVAHTNTKERRRQQQQQQEEGEEERYDCGVEGCYKTFRHEHVGVQTEQQQGLVVSEEQVLGGEL